MVDTFTLVAVGLIIFRAASVSDAFGYLGGIISTSLFSMPTRLVGRSTLLFILALMVLEWLQRDKEHPLQLAPEKAKWLPVVLDYLIIILIIVFGNFEGNQFIYFQF